MKQFLTMLFAGVVIVASSYAMAEEVYVTRNGKKYHKMDCLLIKDKGGKPISIEEATQKDLKPCRKCYGDATVPSDNAAQGLGTDNPVVIK